MKSSGRKGIAIVYLVMFMVVLSALCSLAVDLGRVQLAKTELRRAADGAARAGAAGLVSDTGTASALAVQYGALNKVDGQGLVLDPKSDIEIGFWDTSKLTFTKLSGPSASGANAVRIIAHRTQARGNAIPMLFASLVGFKLCDVNAESIAMVIPPINVDQNILATANPFLSGMPAGSKASVTNPSSRKIPDVAGNTKDPQNSPQSVGMPIIEGQSLTFDSIDGTARHDPNLQYVNPDGDLSEQVGHNNDTTDYNNNYGKTMYNENGIADAWIPINALVGVFLDDSQPNKSSAPANLDFSTDASRDFSTLKPQLKQLFFIGDGLNSSGAHQEFIAPKGATRLFLATMDYYEWNNNAGSRDVKVNRPMQIITVK